ncbi:hypothetical protein BURMUCF1_A1403 [Burkholderia multivorans ATCC BAA-247]|uniref:Uncharacterized protein n=1 Tax=Burkholderia multivorans CGD2 TaxID=513052 RepID=B9BK28_9BURK|nr:hypothetical protein BURMUCGD2_5436 [Burkholderia multivorans CGD2]EEE15982.1 hypothetical protein BURMUCGD2M_5427 [Burkholderia multivorans CGD2M]EJO61807.1 hypothetical protein BURMUCF1_A1403 [Burkholderia multivorans ATCC BAA-247]
MRACRSTEPVGHVGRCASTPPLRVQFIEQHRAGLEYCRYLL